MSLNIEARAIVLPIYTQNSYSIISIYQKGHKEPLIILITYQQVKYHLFRIDIPDLVLKRSLSSNMAQKHYLRHLIVKYQRTRWYIIINFSNRKSFRLAQISIKSLFRSFLVIEPIISFDSIETRQAASRKRRDVGSHIDGMGILRNMFNEFAGGICNNSLY